MDLEVLLDSNKELYAIICSNLAMEWEWPPQDRHVGEGISVTDSPGIPDVKMDFVITHDTLVSVEWANYLDDNGWDNTAFFCRDLEPIEVDWHGVTVMMRPVQPFHLEPYLDDE